MISRLTASALVFATLAAATMAFAAPLAASAPARQTVTYAADGTPVVTLPRVEIVGKRQSR